MEIVPAEWERGSQLTTQAMWYLLALCHQHCATRTVSSTKINQTRQEHNLHDLCFSWTEFLPKEFLAPTLVDCFTLHQHQTKPNQSCTFCVLMENHFLQKISCCQLWRSCHLFIQTLLIKERTPQQWRCDTVQLSSSSITFPWQPFIQNLALRVDKVSKALQYILEVWNSQISLVWYWTRTFSYCQTTNQSIEL